MCISYFCVCAFVCVWGKGGNARAFEPRPLRQQPARTITVARIQLFKLHQKKKINRNNKVYIPKSHVCIFFFLLTYRCRLEAQSTDGVHYNSK